MALARRTQDISPFYVLQVLKQVESLESQGRDVIRLFVGEPDFDVPAGIAQQAQTDLVQQAQGYTASTGIDELKLNIAQRYQRWHGLDIAPERIVVTPGGSTALQVAFLATLNPDDEVLLPEPGYPCNGNLLSTVSAKGVAVNLDPAQGMSLNLAALEAAITEKTRGLLIASPSNPLGSVLTLTQWQAVSSLCQQYQLNLFADEIYHGLSFNGQACCALEADNQAWVIQSFSKFYGMTGWRLGWLVVPEYAIDACERITQNLYLSAPTLAQQAALAGFEPEVEQECFARSDELKKRRDYLVPALAKLKLPVRAQPDGAFYLYVDISHYSENAVDFCRQLLDEQGVALTPGIDFGGPCPQSSVRIAYTVAIPRLQNAIARIEQFLKK